MIKFNVMCSFLSLFVCSLLFSCFGNVMREPAVFLVFFFRLILNLKETSDEVMITLIFLCLCCHGCGSYFPISEQVKKVGRVARAIAIMNHPIPHTDDSHSVQIILPQKQLGRKSDM